MAATPEEAGSSTAAPNEIDVTTTANMLLTNVAAVVENEEQNPITRNDSTDTGSSNEVVLPIEVIGVTEASSSSGALNEVKRNLNSRLRPWD